MSLLFGKGMQAFEQDAKAEKEKVQTSPTAQFNKKSRLKQKPTKI
ncbi:MULTISPECIES: hypothetical protein [Bacillales]|nr:MULTISPECIES: hypothetical protein [Bacillaceae]MDO6655912.1 hypothetical protein [Anaerobacillus sp. 1_MG-2023]WLR60001.1 hypothetical protein LC071_00960 [Pseudalkalibacillus hwajinpoensis]